MNNPFDYIPDESSRRAFQELLQLIEGYRISDRREDIDLYNELLAGKMLGILIASDEDERLHTLYAFSGQLRERGFHHPDFVEPVFDYLSPEGYFKKRETDISCQTREICRYEQESVIPLQKQHDLIKAEADKEIKKYREKCNKSKIIRDQRRRSGNLSREETQAMLRESQFQKAELRRLKKRVAARLMPLSAQLREVELQLIAKKEKRRRDSEQLQQWLFSNVRLLNAVGECRTLSEIFAQTPAGIPPSGAGECCAPKLLQAAYVRGWRPLEIAEYWYGAPKAGEIRIHGNHYPACRGKCLPVLRWMLQGLDVDPPLDLTEGQISAHIGEIRIIFENEWFCVVDKPAGMLSVPGRTGEASVQDKLIEIFGAEREVRLAHRLDQATSGLLIATFGRRSYTTMQSLFATRRVSKEYIADLEGDYRVCGIPSRGRISVPLIADWLDRPRQRVDSELGKESITDYEFLNVIEGRSRVIFHPLTGRTHQLRVHAASHEGIGMPIVGDSLYGLNHRATDAASPSRLHLHARRIEFDFPLDGRRYSFESPVPF